tara:strand:+ start:699 stop:872 length:174 start_codon:yes stop_codon:yes gene_type:complete
VHVELNRGRERTTISSRDSQNIFIAKKSNLKISASLGAAFAASSYMLTRWEWAGAEL